MTITSKPQDRDPLIRRQQDQLGNEEFVGTELLLRFFDDLAQISNTETAVIREIVTTANQQQSKNASLIVALSRQIEALAGKMGDQSQAARVAAIRRDLESSAAATQQQVATLQATVSALHKRQTEIESKTNSLEHLCLSNLVR